MNTQKTWGIIGAGWLGGEMLIHLKDLGIKAWSTNSKSFNWLHDEFPTLPCDVLLLNTPPLTAMPPSVFVGKIQIENQQKILFISSTSVYGELSGNIDENSIPSPSSSNGIWLCEVEQLLLKRFETQVTIIRPGGLIGGSRHPVHSLTKDPSRIVKDGPINLIHRKDLIEILLKVSKLENPPAIVNAVAPFHPLKSIYYNSWAKKLNLNRIQFDPKMDSNRIVDSNILPSIYPQWHHLELDKL